MNKRIQEQRKEIENVNTHLWDKVDIIRPSVFDKNNNYYPEFTCDKVCRICKLMHVYNISIGERHLGILNFNNK
jgi:hypothetical protein